MSKNAFIKTALTQLSFDNSYYLQSENCWAVLLSFKNDDKIEIGYIYSNLNNADLWNFVLCCLCKIDKLVSFELDDTDKSFCIFDKLKEVGYISNLEHYKTYIMC
jgi:hypothetical protein